eukprot:c21336_g2_i1 orf=344-523(+)
MKAGKDWPLHCWSKQAKKRRADCMLASALHTGAAPQDTPSPSPLPQILQELSSLTLLTG